VHRRNGGHFPADGRGGRVKPGARISRKLLVKLGLHSSGHGGVGNRVVVGVRTVRRGRVGGSVLRECRIIVVVQHGLAVERGRVRIVGQG